MHGVSRYSVRMMSPLSSQLHVTAWDQVLLSWPSVRRLLMACAMGGLVGLERERRHKDSGLRTNMLICMAAALFTEMSEVLAGDGPGAKGQVAANIVQGVGFLGAGLILHGRNRVTGLTSAATVFVVAALGMVCGAGLYLEALIATVLVLASLTAIGAVESKLGWKRFPMLYEVRADVGLKLGREAVGAAKAEQMADEVAAASHRMYSAILKAMDRLGQRMRVMDHDNVAGLERVSFSVLATKKEHQSLLKQLREDDATDQVVVFRDTEDE
jgi:putative Mg2+ transporter-C (MgtC) family protein